MQAHEAGTIILSELSAVKQWMALVNEFLESLAMHTEYEHYLPNDAWHKLRLMQALTESLPVPAATMDLPRLYICNNCRSQFDKPSHASFGGSHFGGVGEACPHCGSATFEPSATAVTTEG